MLNEGEPEQPPYKAFMHSVLLPNERAHAWK